MVDLVEEWYSVLEMVVSMISEEEMIMIIIFVEEMEIEGFVVLIFGLMFIVVLMMIEDDLVVIIGLDDGWNFDGFFDFDDGILMMGLGLFFFCLVLFVVFG